jgi:hypothetical protein
VLASGEIGGVEVPPKVIDDSQNFLRDASVVHTGPGELDVTAFVAGVADGESASAPTDRIESLVASAGRTFPLSGHVVLTPVYAWEGGHVGAPSALVVEGPTTGSPPLLFYEGVGGIGLATVSADGVTYAGSQAPVLTSDMIPWGKGRVPTSPAAVQLPDGTMRMFFELDEPDGSVIGEARQGADGTWSAAADGPALARGASGAFDEGSVSTPSAVIATTTEGRHILDLYYTGTSATGAQSIGLAARYVDGGDDGPLVRSPSVMLAPAAALAIRKPSVVRFSTFTLLFATENTSRTSTNPAVIAALAPATETLPPANPR